MRKLAPFAVLLMSSVLAIAALAADLRPIREPAKIDGVFPAAARVRVLNVWAMWCIPCVAEMPDLRAIDEAFGSELAIVGVSLDDMLPDAKREATARFLDKHEIAFPNVYYNGNADALADRLDFSGEIPITIVYDRKGNELWRHQGRIEKDETIARLRELLRRKQ